MLFSTTAAVGETGKSHRDKNLIRFNVFFLHVIFNYTKPELKKKEKTHKN